MKALQKLLILGSGKMGSSLLKGLISNNELNFDISVVEPNLTKDNNDLINKLGINLFSGDNTYKSLNALNDDNYFTIYNWNRNLRGCRTASGIKF